MNRFEQWDKQEMEKRCRMEKREEYVKQEVRQETP
jgi:hypothetical protein